ncbi:MAG: hypothetical protein HC933_03695 [Pleurocapsa sp. SU_196_0]|nr:hypothetical protein [Pleurocapsa sp. SU_196_0]
MLKILDSQPWHTTGSRLLQQLIGTVMLYRCFTEIRYIPILFDALPGQPFPWMYYLGYALWGIGGLSLLFGSWSRLGAVFVLAGFQILESHTAVHDGGDNIIRLVSMYLIAVDPNLTRSGATGWKVFLHNLGVLAILGNLAILYVVSGLAKVNGDLWYNGTALYYMLK